MPAPSMQSTSIEQEPLLSGGNNSELSGTTPLQAYQKGALQGSSATVVQIVGLLFVALIWSLVFSAFPLFQGSSMPLFGYHPMVQSLALLLLLQSIMTLQPTSTSQPSQKESAFKVHQVINLLLVLPLFTLGAAIMWYLHSQPGSSHFMSWHGKIGFTIVIWAWVQVAIGVVIGLFQGRLVGGQTRAKSLYKWHRVSGYILLPLFLLTAYLGAVHTSWASQNASRTHSIAVLLCLVAVAAAMSVRIKPSKLPHL